MMQVIYSNKHFQSHKKKIKDSELVLKERSKYSKEIKVEKSVPNNYRVQAQVRKDTQFHLFQTIKLPKIEVTSLSETTKNEYSLTNYENNFLGRYKSQAHSPENAATFSQFDIPQQMKPIPEHIANLHSYQTVYNSFHGYQDQTSYPSDTLLENNIHSYKESDPMIYPYNHDLKALSEHTELPDTNLHGFQVPVSYPYQKEFYQNKFPLHAPYGLSSYKSSPQYLSPLEEYQNPKVAYSTHSDYELPGEYNEMRSEYEIPADSGKIQSDFGQHHRCQSMPTFHINHFESQWNKRRLDINESPRKRASTANGQFVQENPYIMDPAKTLSVTENEKRDLYPASEKFFLDIMLKEACQFSSL
jgi:hypothetical protein